MTSPPEPLVRIQNNFTELFLILPSTSNCTNGSTPPSKGAARALDKKCLLMTFPPEPFIEKHNYFTELFLMMTSTRNCPELHKQFRSA